ncbi:unnamed protein product [Amoebophrya sp. A120]|nr:unnamed protein product [Amoebophrya sp. A120]|eukprot:GSA120T00012043001.1
MPKVVEPVLNLMFSNCGHHLLKSKFHSKHTAMHICKSKSGAAYLSYRNFDICISCGQTVVRGLGGGMVQVLELPGCDMSRFYSILKIGIWLISNRCGKMM